MHRQSALILLAACAVSAQSDAAQASTLKSEIAAIASAVSSYSAAHMTDAPYQSIQAFLSTQTAVPKSAIKETEIGDFFTPVVPPNLVTVLPTELQSYASAYLGSASAIESSIVGTNTGAITASFSGGAGGGAAATATTSTSATSTPTQSAASGAGAVTADGRSTMVVLSGMIAGVLGLVMMM